MKSILMSIQPKWCEKIESRAKTIEVRKTRPKIETPFKVYIYCTKSKEVLGTDKIVYWTGEVIGEFVCDRIDEYTSGIPPFYEASDGYNVYPPELEKMCLGYKDLDAYGKGKPLYGWHISELKIYDQPKELSDFVKIKPCENDFECPDDCPSLEWKYYSTPDCKEWDTACRTNLHKPLTRPPQSYMYVEELEE